MTFCAEKSKKNILKPLDLLDPQFHVTSGRMKLIGQHHPDKNTKKLMIDKTLESLTDKGLGIGSCLIKMSRSICVVDFLVAGFLPKASNSD